MNQLKELQALWYAKLVEAGFEDIEDASGALKSNGRSTPLNDNREYAPQEYARAQADSFSHDANFERACAEVCRHGNSTLTPELVKSIWHGYCKGESIRTTAKRLNLFRDLVARATNKMIGLMHLLGDNMSIAQSEENATVVVRAFRPDTDTGFIHATWRNALWYADKRDDSIAEGFYRGVSKFIKILLDMPTTTVRVACLSDSPDTIVGYAAMSTTNLDWVYVKINYRKQGVATLLTSGFKTVSKPRTPIGVSIVENKKLKVLNE